MQPRTVERAPEDLERDALGLHSTPTIATLPFCQVTYIMAYSSLLQVYRKK